MQINVTCLHYAGFDSKMLLIITRQNSWGVNMEFFRKHQRAIIFTIAVTFIAWTVGLMLLPALVK